MSCFFYPPGASSLITQADADSFYTACNGNPFNSIEDAVCQLIYVERAEVIKSEEVRAVPRGLATADRKDEPFRFVRERANGGSGCRVVSPPH